MAADPGAPADTFMMGVIHDALRRDLRRSRVVLAGPAPPNDRQRDAVTRHVSWMMDFLHHHHHNEDTLWPVVRQRRPDAVALLDRMDADHAAISAEIDRVVAANDRYAADGGDAARADLTDALERLDAVLSPHLDREEAQVMPIVSASMTDRELRAWEASVRPKMSLPVLIDAVNWFLDELDDDRAGKFLPAPVRFALVRILGREYRRRCALRWGSPAAVATSKGGQP